MVGHDIRLQLEAREESLAPYATKSRLSRGRERPEEPCPVRTAFQRDRDRIIHCKAFRRLMHKTQVFIAPKGDHYVTRLTHTLQVSQIARTIARALNLNEDLTEAISLGHDLGHPPFGHAGEEVLASIYPQGFSHNEQSVRVVEFLENDGMGLNLTWEVRDGIRKHSKPRDGIIPQDEGSLEGQICKIADAVAYINHDLADAIRAGIIGEGDLPPEITKVLGASPRERINTLVCDIINGSQASMESSHSEGTPVITMSPEVLEAANSLRQFLFQRVYSHELVVAENEKAKQIVRRLYEYYCQNPNELSSKYLGGNNSPQRIAVDYIAGMTDRFATQACENLHSTKLRAVET